MLKRALILLAVLVCFPAFASAWTLTAKIGSPSGSITGGSPPVTVTSGTGFLTIPTGDTTVTITPSAGYTVSLVTLDSVQVAVPPQGGVMTVPQAGKSSRTLTAYFTTATYSLTASQSAGGVLSLQQISPTVGTVSQTGLSGLRNGAVVKITAAPNADYAVTAIKVGNSTVWSGNSTLPAVYNYSVSSNQIVSATFVLIPKVTARLIAGDTITTPGGTISLDASTSTTNDGPLTYLFSVASGDPTKVTLTPAGPSTSPVATFSASEIGTYSIVVTVTSAHGATSTASSGELSVITQSANDSGVCISCHANRDSLLVAQFQQSVHYASAGVNCSNCHNPDGTLPHHYLTSPVDVCQTCHTTEGTQVSASPHVVQGCTGCHSDHSEQASYNICTRCHSSVFGAQGMHENAQADLANYCGNCHGPHTFHSTATRPHFANGSSAQYITPNLNCAKCHNEVDVNGTVSFVIYSATRQWARSGKGDPRSAAYLAYDFKMEGNPASPTTSAAKECVKCHTTTGYINYVTSGYQDVHAWGSAEDRTREMVACSACHDPTPFNSYDTVDPYTMDVVVPAYSRRDVPEVTAFYNFSGAGGRIMNAVPIGYDAGTSNNCIICHSGTAAGSTLKLLANKVGAQGAFWNDTPLIDPHSMGAAGVLFSKTGYQYGGRSYSGPLNFVHWSVGDGDPGSCIVCHMSSDKEHSFSPISSAGGRITKITAFDSVCSYCHDNTTKPIPLNDPATLDGKKQQFISSLKVLREVLAAKGIYFNPAVAPYFFSVPDPAAQGPATAYKTWNAFYAPGTPALYNGSDLMGAAFNLRLLWGDAGAYTHNSFYARRLIYDSIDLADNGQMDSKVGVTIQNIAVSPTLSADDKTRATAYVGVRP